jgi:hypothetical protein
LQSRGQWYEHCFRRKKGFLKSCLKQCYYPFWQKLAVFWTKTQILSSNFWRKYFKMGYIGYSK